MLKSKLRVAISIDVSVQSTLQYGKAYSLPIFRKHFDPV